MAKRADRQSGKGKAGSGGSGEDAELFRRVMADAAPLKKRGYIRPVDLPPVSSTPARSHHVPRGPARPAAKPAGNAASVPFFTPPAQAATPPQPTETSTSADRLAGIDRRTADRLRRGKLAIEGRIDLHGSFQDEAHRALNGFIVDAAAAGKRVVLVITGKGRVSEGGGVLRRNVPHWLRLPPCAPHVLAVVPAQPQHGGSGALYVMLRRKRG